MADKPTNHGRGGKNQDNRARGRGGRGGGRGRGFGSKSGGRKGDMGRGEWSRNDLDKRKRNDDEQAAKRRRIEAGDEDAAHPFSKEEIEGEARKPKRKVAVMIGYAGSGYKGMQINSDEKTIEGDLFKAFVAAGAISKANADDPKKSSLVRCARTDKGVHAAGNVISLKLIVEESDIIQKINENLPPQIRIWGIERTNGSFSCYQTCDSRWYEYLIPTFAFIPPHPQSFLARKLVESAEKEGVFETYQSRQEDTASFWKEAEDKYVKPILDILEPSMAKEVMRLIHSEEEENVAPKKQIKKDLQAARQLAANSNVQVKDEQFKDAVVVQESKDLDLKMESDFDVLLKTEQLEDAVVAEDSTGLSLTTDPDSNFQIKTEESEDAAEAQEVDDLNPKTEPDSNVLVRTEEPEYVATGETVGGSKDVIVKDGPDSNVQVKAEQSKSVLSPLELAIKQVKAAYVTAKKAYRISDARRQRVQEALDCYLGTCNFHNYTIQKSFKDPSAKRVIRSFKVGSKPIIINDTEWLSLKVHGQSFMMHQIRKMVAMAAIVVRCGSPKSIIKESYGPANISIPKAPGLGLLLERPVFDSYNERAVREFDKEKIDFDKYQVEMDEFKQREIYDRIFREEEKDHQFHAFFHHVDHYRTDYFLWATASGIAAATQSKAPARTDDISDDEEADVNGQEG